METWIHPMSHLYMHKIFLGVIPVRTPYLCVFIFIYFFEKKYC